MKTTGMKEIGRGVFSTVYQHGRNKVLIKSRDSVKECMAMGWFPTSPMFPALKRVGSSDCGEFQLYEEKFYPKVKSLKSALSSFEWEFYRELRVINEEWKDPKISWYQHFQGRFASLPGKFHHKRDRLLEALDGLSNYGEDMVFEISPRNVTVHNKKLVLLDCFFMESQLKSK
jgi:hypothetical protein